MQFTDYSHYCTHNNSVAKNYNNKINELTFNWAPENSDQFTHLQNFLQLVLILNNDNIGFTVFRNKVTGLWRICGVNADSKASEITGS